MRYLDPAATRASLGMSDAIAAMERAFGDDREVPVRVLLGPSLFMPGRVGADTGIKVVSTVPGHPAGIVAVFGSDGACRGLVDGPTLTAIRTAAGAGLATRLLARPDAAVLAMLGAGAMAHDQVVAVTEVRPIREVLVWSRDPDRAAALAERVGGKAVADPDEAVGAADIVSTATPSRSPLFHPGALRGGTHINAVGAFSPEMVEIPGPAVIGARVFVDDLAAAAAEAGDLIQAGKAPDGTIADLLAGRVRGRSTEEQVTMFKSVGIASQDVAAAVAALDRAEHDSLGIEIG